MAFNDYGCIRKDAAVFLLITSGSEKKIVQALFFSLTLHYLCILN